jgi:hypothetical protein
MRMEGTFHIALKPSVSEGDFVRILQQNFSTSEFLTRVTEAVGAQLLKVEEDTVTPHYILDISVELMTDRPYNFATHAPEIADMIGDLGVIIQIDTFTVVEVGLASAK